MPVSFRYAQGDEYPRIAAFLNDYWAKGHIYVRDKDLFDWTFRRQTHWDESDYSFALAEDNGELVGILGGIPFGFNSFGNSARGIWIANYVIRPDHRRGPTALQLLGMFRRPSMQAVVAFGINPATSSIYRVLRGEVLPYIPRRVIVFPGATDRMIQLLRLTYSDWSPERATTLAERLSLDALPPAVTTYGEMLPVDWDTLDWPAIAAETIGTARDSQYLKWRYLEHPRFKYQIITVADGTRTGLLIWRLETIRRAAGETREDVDRIGRVLEFLPVSPDNARDLLAVGLRRMHDAGALGADFYGYHSEMNRYLDESGFVATSGIPDGDLIPSRFQPLDGKGGGILSAVFLQTPAPSFNGSSPWYWTKSDSDQDRPN
jgi:hypothetical protein